MELEIRPKTCAVPHCVLALGWELWDPHCKASASPPGLEVLSGHPLDLRVIIVSATRGVSCHRKTSP
eukprot:4206578-Prymnesium_polylepis.1